MEELLHQVSLAEATITARDQQDTRALIVYWLGGIAVQVGTLKKQISAAEAEYLVSHGVADGRQQ